MTFEEFTQLPQGTVLASNYAALTKYSLGNQQWSLGADLRFTDEDAFKKFASGEFQIIRTGRNLVPYLPKHGRKYL